MQIPPLPSQTYRSPEPGDDGAGTADTTSSPATEAGSQPADTGTTGTAPADVGTKAGTMLEAMFGQKTEQPTAAETAEAAATGKTVQQLRDDRGRFAGKAPADAQAGDPAKPQQPKPGERPEHQMPDGLKPEGQKRFQTLVNENKELTAQLAGITQAAGSLERAGAIIQNALAMQETFQQNGVRREQFDQAMEAVGMINRGDLMGALKVLDEQRALISMAIGKPLPGADPLAQFPDLRSKVDNLQITEEDAIEMARNRVALRGRQQADQRQHQEQTTQAQAEQAHRAGVNAVDAVCKRLMQSDLDFATIEPLLIKEIEGGLFQGIPPSQWARIVEKTYGLIKQTAGTVRSQAPAATVLRSTGGESPRQAPKTMHEAMWGKA